MTLKWYGQFTDHIYQKGFNAGVVEVPGHDGTDGSHYGIPHMAFIQGTDVTISSAQ